MTDDIYLLDIILVNNTWKRLRPFPIQTDGWGVTRAQARRTKNMRFVHGVQQSSAENECRTSAAKEGILEELKIRPCERSWFRKRLHGKEQAKAISCSWDETYRQRIREMEKEMQNTEKYPHGIHDNKSISASDQNQYMERGMLRKPGILKAKSRKNGSWNTSLKIAKS